MEKWAWVLALTSVVRIVVQGLVGIFTGGAIAVLCGSMGLVAQVIILVYLLRPDFCRAFGIRIE